MRFTQSHSKLGLAAGFAWGALGLLLASASAFAADNATWGSAAASDDWNTGGNWDTGTAPNGSSDTAFFGLTNRPNVSVSQNTEVSSITFGSLANLNPFTITADPSIALTVSGTGITNNSGHNQNFATSIDSSGDFGSITFNNSATAGSLTVFTNSGATDGQTVRVPGGETNFNNTSTAGSATINNNGGGTAVFGGGGIAEGGGANFNNSSTAGNATINNNAGSNNFGAFGGGYATFNDTSTAGSATIVNNGSADANHGGGATNFGGNSTAGNATIGDFAGLGYGGTTTFFASATAGSATINNYASAAAAGDIGFGYLDFSDSATAGNATINNYGTGFSGPEGPSAEGALTDFQVMSTAGNAVINNYGATSLAPFGEGVTRFDDNTTAGAATINNLGSALSGGVGGQTLFLSSSFGSSTAGSATLIATAGTNGGGGGSILFEGDSTGGTARVEVSGNGYLDISYHSALALTIGSLEGSGNVFLGANNLTVGSNNLSTTFSGVAQDGGVNGGTGGSIIKTGTGTLELTGANTHTGGTSVHEGTLLVNNTTGSGTGSGPVAVNAGTLGGSGIIAGAVTIGTGKGISATLSPGDSPGTLTIQSSLTFKSDGIYKFEYDSSNATSDEVIAHGVTINTGAQFSLTDLGTGVLASGTVFTAIDDTDPGAIGGFFANLTDHSMVTEDGNTFEVNYEGGDGNDLTLTVESGGTSVPDKGSTFLLLAMSFLGLVSYQHLRSCRTPPATA